MLPESLETTNETALALNSRFAEAIVEVHELRNELALIIAPEAILPICQALKADFGFERVSGITGVDWWPRTPRFEVVYLLHSIRNNRRLRLKARLGESESIDSVYPVWRGANWYEREVFDLFGIHFRNHPNLERIVMPSDWEGHPLRKDYPIHGHRYSYSDE